jgi:hypothetical protein
MLRLGDIVQLKPEYGHLLLPSEGVITELCEEEHGWCKIVKNGAAINITKNALRLDYAVLGNIYTRESIHDLTGYDS